MYISGARKQGKGRKLVCGLEKADSCFAALLLYIFIVIVCINLPKALSDNMVTQNFNN